MIYLLGEVLERLNVKGVRECNIWRAWDKMVGPQVSRHCQPERIKDGILFLKVSSPVWMQQLQFMKQMMMEKVNGVMGDKPVRDLMFRIGRIEKAKKIGRDFGEISLSRETLATIDEELSSVRDPELKEAIRRVRVKEERARGWRSQRSKGGSS